MNYLWSSMGYHGLLPEWPLHGLRPAALYRSAHFRSEVMTVPWTQPTEDSQLALSTVGPPEPSVSKWFKSWFTACPAWPTTDASCSKLDVLSRSDPFSHCDGWIVPSKNPGPNLVLSLRFWKLDLLHQQSRIHFFSTRRLNIFMK